MRNSIIWVALSTGLAAIARFGADILMSRLLGPEGKGHVALLVSTSMVAASVAGLGLPAANTYFSAAKPRWYRALSRLSLKYALAWAFPGFLIVAIWRFYRLPDFQFGTNSFAFDFMFALAVIFPSTLYLQLGRALLLGDGQIRAYNATWIIQYLTILVILVLVRPRSYPTVYQIVIWSTLATALLMARFVTWKPRGESQEDLNSKDVSIYGIKTAIGGVFQLLTYRFDILILAYFLGPIEIGVYSVSVLLGEGVWLLGNAVATVIFPRISKGEGGIALIRIIRLTTLISLCAVGAIICCGGGIALIFGSGYQRAWGNFCYLALGVVAIPIQKVFSAEFSGKGLPAVSSMAAVYSFILTLILDPWVVPRWGINGAAAVSTISYTTGALYLMYQYKRHNGLRWRPVLEIFHFALDADYLKAHLRRLTGRAS